MVAAAAALVLAAGCAEEPAPVLAPKGPGEGNATVTDERTATAGGAKRNDADTAYVRKMIHHHRQAVVMTDLVPDRAHRGGIEKIADRMSVAQGTEIDAMEQWLDKGECKAKAEEPGHDHGGSDNAACPPIDHDSMPGMASKAQLADLKDAEGKEFDTLFVDLMTTHHEGAITMAEDVVKNGKDTMIRSMANDVIVEQRTEIDRMDSVLDG
ncbi:DUF305 domain-containing protein [Murinocardiopsis flavida]|nr:DUF305 domain-containing protein [Murinocardiopsis flavida]